MLRGSRLFITAIAGLIALIAFGIGLYVGALSEPQYRQQSIECSNARANHARCGPSQIDTDRAGLPYAAERIAANPEPRTSEERERRDLFAQETSALWAFWGLVISAISAIVTALGTVLLLCQIFLTRRAVSDTSKATEAMHIANDIAETTYKNQLRAWAFPDDFKVEITVTAPIEEGGSVFITIFYKVRNTGLSPTLNAYSRIRYTENNNNVIEDSKPIFEQVKEMEEGQGFSVAPGHFMPCSQSFCFPAKEILAEDGSFGVALFSIFVCYRTAGNKDVFTSIDVIQLQGKDLAGSAMFGRTSEPLPTGKPLSDAVAVCAFGPSIMR